MAAKKKAAPVKKKAAPAKKKAAPAKKKAAPAKKKAAPAKKKAAPAKKKAAPAKKKAAPAKKKAAPVKKKAAPAKKKAAPAKKKAAAPKVVMPKTPPVRTRSHVLGDTEKTPVQSAAAVAPAAPAPVENSGSNRREFLRVPYGAWVKLMHETGSQLFCLARDLSLGGMFLKSANPPPLGQELKLVIVIENDRTPLEVHGLVVRRSEGEQGFGVRFMGVDSATASRVQELVADVAAGKWRTASSSPPQQNS